MTTSMSATSSRRHEVTVDAAPRATSRKGPYGRAQDSVGVLDIAYEGTGRSSTAQGWRYSSNMLNLKSGTYSCKHLYLPDCLLSLCRALPMS
jgi:hypothetical protein